MKLIKFLLLISLLTIFWGCSENSPLKIEQITLEQPNTKSTIITENLFINNDFSIGYQNGNIRSNRVSITWNKSEESEFLCYKLLKTQSNLNFSSEFNFGDEEFLDSWNLNEWEKSEKGKGFLGDYSLTFNGNGSSNILETDFDIPQNSGIIISFYLRSDQKIETFFSYGNENIVEISSDEWRKYSYYFFNTNLENISLSWDTNHCETSIYLDALTIIGTKGDFELIESFNDINTTSFTDSLLISDKNYLYNLVTMIENGMSSSDIVSLKTANWKAPNNIHIDGTDYNSFIANWNDNSDNEDSFKLYLEKNENLEYSIIDSFIIAKNTTSKVITGLETEGIYRVSIKAISQWENDTNMTYSSNYVAILTEVDSFSLQKEMNSKAINLTWNDNSTIETSYVIERKLPIAQDYSTLVVVQKNIEEYTDFDTSSFHYGDEIYYRIKAINNNTGEESNYIENSIILLETTDYSFDFENSPIPSFFEMSGNADWIIDENTSSSGQFSLKSGNISNNNQSIVTLKILIKKNTNYQISFDYKTSSEMFCDYLYCYINDNYVLSKSGINDWQNSDVFLINSENSNEISIKWFYEKNGSISSYDDSVWIDNIKIEEKY